MNARRSQPIAKQKPSIDLEINFEYNSATISSVAQVTALGQALTSPDLKGSTFVLAGHTDAKGADSYNLGLSERRADAVKRFLTQKFRDRREQFGDGRLRQDQA